MSDRRIVIAGGSGFLGCRLSHKLLGRGCEVTVLSRAPDRAPAGPRGVAWDGRTQGDWARHLDGAFAVVNLTGRNVNCRYTKRNLHEIDASRVDSVRAVGRAIAECRRPPRALVQAATTAIYGDAGDRVCDETAPLGEGIPVRTATMWGRRRHGSFTSVRFS